MNVIIKGMDKPKGCWECRFVESLANKYYCKAKICPINAKHLLKGYFPPPDNCPLEPYREDGDTE